MADKGTNPGIGKKRKPGKFCVAGGPGQVSCNNTNEKTAVSMHLFPSNNVVRNKWVKFVHKHRPNFKPTKTSVLCSIHFAPECFTRRLDLELAKSKEKLSGSRHLVTGSFPTIDVAVEKQQESTDLTDRERRMVKRKFTSPMSCCSTALSSPATEEKENDPELTRVIPDEDVQEIMAETPVGTQSPPSLPSCDRCPQLSQNIRSLQKENSYLRKTKRELKYKLNCIHVNESSENEEEEIAADKPIICQEDEALFSTGSEAGDDNADANWASLEEDGTDSTSDKDDDDKERKVRIERNTPVENEPKFLVFYSMLLSLFTMFCFRCKTGKPKVEMKQTGTMVTVLQHCSDCGGNPYTWRSQPYHPVLGRYPLGNVLLSFAVLLAGASISKVLLVFRHMGLSAYCVRTYFVHQKKFVFPAILHHWETYRTALINQLKATKDVVWSGDGRFDSMGHNAKYGAYTMFCSTITKIVHFELLQANETGSSVGMELEGAKRSFNFLQRMGLSVATFVSDRHRGIAKWIRLFQPQTSHFFDIWHVARSINKKLLKASQEKGCETIKDWMRGVRNHLYWCVTTTMQGFENLILAKWKSFMRHLSNKHKDHPDALFTACAHDVIAPRKWIKIGTKAYDKVSSILTSTRILGDIKKLSADTQTSCLEGFHATLNHWHPKMIHFSWLGTFCRHILASLHFNENVKRETQTDKDGKPYFKVSYPKFKLGEEVVREVAVQPTYEYVDDIRKILFSLSLKDLSDVRKKYEGKVPVPMNRQFPERVNKDEAIKNKESRKRTWTELFPPEAEQNCMQTTAGGQPSTEPAAVGGPPTKKKAPSCRKCKQPMRGHPRGQCPVPVTTQETTNI